MTMAKCPGSTSGSCTEAGEDVQHRSIVEMKHAPVRAHVAVGRTEGERIRFGAPGQLVTGSTSAPRPAHEPGPSQNETMAIFGRDGAVASPSHWPASGISQYCDVQGNFR